MGILFKSKKGHELHAIRGLSEKLYIGALYWYYREIRLMPVYRV